MPGCSNCCTPGLLQGELLHARLHCELLQTRLDCELLQLLHSRLLNGVLLHASHAIQALLQSLLGHCLYRQRLLQDISATGPQLLAAHAYRPIPSIAVLCAESDAIQSEPLAKR